MCRKQPTYHLRAHKGAVHSTSVKASIPSGQWDGFMSRKRPTYILRAHKGAIHSTSAKRAPHRGDGMRHGGAFGGVLVASCRTYINSVRVDLARLKRDAGAWARNKDATSPLPKTTKHISKSKHPIGVMGWRMVACSVRARTPY